MKRFLAGVLTVISALCLSMPAYASNIKNITRPKEITYDILAKQPKPNFQISLGAHFGRYLYRFN